MIECIVHISDIHIKSDSYNNLTFAFERLIDNIKKITRPFILVIAGDVFENKTYLTTDDIYMFYKIMDSLEQNKISTIIIPGNHDYNVNSKLVKNNIDILTRRYNHIKCISETSEYKISGINFAVYSPIDGKTPKFDENYINVAILHEPVNQAKYDTGESITGGRFNIEDLSHWDYTLLGDIHKPQFLTPRMAYSGSFVQKTKGEGLDHGYILWDLIKGTGKHVFIPMAEVYLKIEAADNKCSLPTLLKSQKIRYVTFMYENCSHEFIKNMTETIESKYGSINKVVNKNNYTNSLISLNGGIKEEEKQKILCNSGELLKTMLDDFKVDDETKNKILENHGAFLQNRKEINYTNYVLSYLKWSNVLCYGEGNHINFNDFTNDFVVLNGNNMSGKSSVIDIIVRALFNENYRGHKNDIVNKKKKNGYIELGFSVRENQYVIRLDFSKGIRQSVHHRLYENGKNITKDTINNTYKYIRETIGIGDYKDFVNMTTALQNRKFLIDMDKKDLLGIFTKILDIDVLRDLENNLSSEIRTKNKMEKEYTKDLQYYVVPDIKEKENEYAKVKETHSNLKSDEARLVKRLLNLNKDYVEFDCNIELVKKDIEQYSIFKDSKIYEVDVGKLSAIKDKRAVLKSKLGKHAGPTDQSQLITKEKYKHNLSEIDRLIFVSNSKKPLDFDIKKKSQYEKCSKMSKHEVKSYYAKLVPCEHKYDATIKEDFSEEMKFEMDSLRLKLRDKIIPANRDKSYLSLIVKKYRNKFGDAEVLSENINELRNKQDVLRAKLKNAPIESSRSKEELNDIIKKWESCEFVHNPNITEIPDDVDKLQLYIDRVNFSISSQLNSQQFAFAHGCQCCDQNKVLVHEAQNAQNVNYARGRIPIITSYLAGLVLEAQWARYHHIGLKIEASEAVRDLAELENLERWDRYNYLAKCEQNEIVKKNALIESKILNLEKINLEIDEAVQKFSEIISYENYLNLKNLQQQNTNYEAFQLAELEKYIAEKEKMQTCNASRAQYFKQVDILNNYNKNKKIRLLIHSTEKELAAVRTQIEQVQKDQDSLAAQIQIAQITKTAAERLQQKIAQNTAELNLLKIHLKCVDHKKGLPSLMMKNACSILNTRINQVLQHITDFTIEFKYNEGFLINTIEPGKTIPADMGSGFQKFVLDIIMRVVLTNISPVSNPNMIFIDEGFGCLDKENFIHVASILKKLKSNFSAMFVVTHIPELKAYADKTIMIGRIRGDSVIKHGGAVAEIKFDTSGDLKKPPSKASVSVMPVNVPFIKIDNKTYKCLACKVERKYTAALLERHLAAKSYRAKHANFV